MSEWTKERIAEARAILSKQHWPWSDGAVESLLNEIERLQKEVEKSRAISGEHILNFGEGRIECPLEAQLILADKLAEACRAEYTVDHEPEGCHSPVCKALEAYKQGRGK